MVAEQTPERCFWFASGMAQVKISGSDSSGGQANLTALTGGRRAVQNQGSTAPSLPLCLAFAAHRLFITSKSPHQASLGSDQVRHPTGKQILASVLQSTGSGLLCLTFSNLLSPGSRNTGLRFLDSNGLEETSRGPGWNVRRETLKGRMSPGPSSGSEQTLRGQSDRRRCQAPALQPEHRFSM